MIRCLKKKKKNDQGKKEKRMVGEGGAEGGGGGVLPDFSNRLVQLCVCGRGSHVITDFCQPVNHYGFCCNCYVCGVCFLSFFWSRSTDESYLLCIFGF